MQKHLMSVHYYKCSRLNLLKMEKSKEEVHPHREKYKDKYNLVYILFAQAGVILLVPATFFTTANDFWMYKFRNTSFEEADSDDRTTLQVDFSPSVTISSFTASVILQFFVLFFGQKINYKFRLYASLVTVLLLYIIAAILINVDTDSWQTAYFVLTMIIVAGISGIGGVFGLTFYSVISKFPTEYLGSFLNGQAIAGIITGCLQILSLAIGISTTGSAMVYFWIVIGFVLFFIVYLTLIFKFNNFFNHYNNQESIQDQKGEENKNMTIAELISMLKLVWKSLAILFFYLLTVNPTHPAITSLVVSEGEGNGDWNDVYFVPVITFFLVSVFDFIGRQLPIKFSFFTKIDPIWYVGFSALRLFIFVPLIMLCNAQPRSHLDVIFPHDYQYIIIVLVLAFTNGFLLCLGQFIIPEIVPPENLEDGYKVNLSFASILMGGLSFLGFISVDLL